MALPKPETRREMYLANIAGEGNDIPEKPITREEMYLDDIAKNGGGGGGTNNYNQLNNKPQIDGVTLSGNKTASDLGLATDAEMTGATAQEAGQKGLVPAPGAGDAGKFLGGDGQWHNVSGGGSAELSEALTVTRTVGGVEAGTTYAQGTDLEDIFKDMLNPVEYPELVGPSVTLTATGAKLLETGATQEVTFTAAFDRGSINPAYGTSGYRAGAATGYSLNGGTEQEGGTFVETVSAAQKTYKAAVSYAAGEQPKDSTGAYYSTPLSAGSVESNTITYEFADAIWANTAAIGTIAKLALVSKSAKQKDFIFPAQTVANPEVFDIPASWTVTAVQVKNDLSGVYEDASDQFTVTDTAHDDAAGNSVAYKRYTFNLGYGTGARTVRVKWN